MPVSRVALALLPIALISAAEPSGPAVDRVGLPDYSGYAFLRTFYASDRNRVGLVYANPAAASIAAREALPYPYGSIFVVEWRDALSDPAGAPLRDANGDVRGGDVVQIDVMRRERGYGAAYGAARTGEWEYVSYNPDRSHFVAPGQSGACAACHQRAGAGRDFVFRGRFPAAERMTME